MPALPSLGFINLLEWLLELREIFYLQDYWLVIKGYNSGTATQKSCRGRGMSEGQGAPLPSLGGTLPALTPVLPPRNTPNPHFFEFSWKLHHTAVVDSIIGHWWLNQPPAPYRLPRYQGVRLKGPKL